MKNPIFIFDFDGTIADTHQFLINVYNDLSGEFKYKKIEPDDVDNLKDKTIHEVVRILKIPVMRIPSMISKAKKEFHKEILTLQPFKNLKETLLQLQELGVSMGILSSNTQENITKFLHNHQINSFDFVHSTSRVLSKNNSLSKLIEKNGFDKDEIVYIGDEVRDIAAARKLGIKVAAVTWGYNSAKALKEHRPDYLINSPEELFGLCSGMALGKCPG